MSHREILFPELKNFISRYGLEQGKNKKVLEIGPSDTVDFKNYFEELGYEYLGVDNNTKNKSNFCVIGNMEKIPFADNSFDIIFSCHSFEHTEANVQALREMKRCSRKYIIIFTPNECLHQTLMADTDHINVLNERQMERLFRYVGITKLFIYTQKDGIKLEQDFNLCSFGEV